MTNGIPQPDDSDEAALLVGIAQGFARSLAQALEHRPDLIEGFLADRYRFALKADHVQILETHDPDFHRLFGLEDH